MNTVAPITNGEMKAAEADFARKRKDSSTLDLQRATKRTAEALMAAFPAERITETFERCLTATVSVVRGRGDGAHEVQLQDHRTQLAALTLLLAYQLGRPVERQEIISVNVDADSEAGLLERLKSSPALRAQLRKVLDAADEAGPVVEG